VHRPLVVPAIALLSTACGGAARADVRLPAVISSRMVLQQRSDVAIWGWADPGEGVAVKASWGAAAAPARADAGGRWRVMLRTPEAGGPHSIEIAGRNVLRLDDVLVGEVWLCGGQSNMEWAFAYGGVNDAAAERAAADDPRVRLFDVPNTTAAKPVDDCRAQWLACTPESVNGFSSVGWFFARELRAALRVPVGLIGVNWGGTVAQAWVSREALAPFARFRGDLERCAAAAGGSDRAWPEWWRAVDSADLGARNGWAAPGFDDAGWEEAPLAGAWDGPLAGFDGAVWYRRALEFPRDFQGRELDLTFGPIDDMDTVWLDGERVGGTEVHGRFAEPRSYRLPAARATAGRHVLAVRIVDTGGPGGMAGDGRDCGLRLVESPNVSVVFTGPWKRRVSLEARALPPLPAAVQPLHANVATALWNGMLAPIVPFGIRGALWYQGESNRGHAAEYADLMPALIADWRARFERPGFPFLFVQIAPFNYDGSRAATAELRQAQLETLRVPHTGMVVTMDIGDPADIHPGNKQEVGRRLALWALAQTYDEEVEEFSGPLFESQTVEGRRIRVRFTHTTGGLVARGDEGATLTDFEIRGADGKWHPAQAVIDGVTVLVSSAAVPEPQEARFGFGDACSPNLLNGAGLPASPFCRIAR